MTVMVINEIKHPTLSTLLKGAMCVSTTVVLLYLKMSGAHYPENVYSRFENS